MTPKTCPVCQSPIEKRGNESRSVFNARTTCSIKCGAIYRQSAKQHIQDGKAATMEQAAMRLDGIVRGWGNRAEVKL